MSEDLRDNATVQRFKTVEDAIRSTLSAQQMVGADKIALPKRDDEEGWGELWSRLGRPAAPEDYEIGVPDGGRHDEAFESAMRTAFHAAGLNTDQVTTVVDAYNERAVAALQGLETAQAEMSTAEATALKRAWGAGHDDNVAGARAAALALGLDAARLSEMEGALGYTGLLKHFHGLYDTYGIGREDDAFGQGSDPFALLSESAQRQIQRVSGDKDFMAAYLDKQHPDHKAALDRMTRLHTLAHPAIE